MRQWLIIWVSMVIATLLSLPVRAETTPATQVGVYYFPGWRNDMPYAPSPRPWERLLPYKEREPLLGWYNEGADDVMRQHLDWMTGAGLKFVVFDWYWDIDNKVYLDHALGAYFRSPKRAQLPFSIMWANHGKAPNNRENWDRMVAFWLRFYAPRPEMLKVDGKPVVFIFLARELETMARKFGSSSAELLAGAQVQAKNAGLPGLYFVAGAASEETAVIKSAEQTGYAAVTMYNLHRPPFVQKESHSYMELDAAYRSHWRTYDAVSPVPVFYPMTSGWDKRPWGGSTDPKHDGSMAIPSEFATHLAAAKSAIQSGRLRPGQATRWGLICCWNEFGEGSFIEPTRVLGTAMLDAVRTTFGPGKLSQPKE